MSKPKPPMIQPIQLSIDPTIAPDVKLTPIARPTNQRALMNRAVGLQFHRIAQRRANNTAIAACGLWGRIRNEVKDTTPYCPDCYPR